MTTHELAKVLQEGPDLPLVIPGITYTDEGNGRLHYREVQSKCVVTPAPQKAIDLSLQIDTIPFKYEPSPHFTLKVSDVILLL